MRWLQKISWQWWVVVVVILVTLLPIFNAPYAAIFAAPSGPDDHVPVESATAGLAYTSWLSGFPHTYQIDVATTTSLTVTLREPVSEYAQQRTSLLMVKQETRRLSEVARLTTSPQNWQAEKSQLSQSHFLTAGARSVELSPGRYLLEISSPMNMGPYHLTLNEGNITKGSLWSTAGTVLDQRSFYGLPVSAILYSPVVWGIFLVLLFLSRKTSSLVIRKIWRK